MLDGLARHIVDPALHWLARPLARLGMSPHAVSLAGAAAAVVCGVLIASGAWGWAILALIVSRLADGLDGTLAAHTGRSDFGGFLDILCDFVFYAAVPVGFALHDPAQNAVAASILLASFYINAASFLGFAIIAARRGMTTRVRGEKSLYFTTGLMEGTETIVIFLAMLAWPGHFAVFAYIFAGLCGVTCLARALLAWRIFGVDEAQK